MQTLIFLLLTITLYIAIYIYLYLSISLYLLPNSYLTLSYPQLFSSYTHVVN